MGRSASAGRHFIIRCNGLVRRDCAASADSLPAKVAIDSTEFRENRANNGRVAEAMIRRVRRFPQVCPTPAIARGLSQSPNDVWVPIHYLDPLARKLPVVECLQDERHGLRRKSGRPARLSKASDPGSGNSVIVR